MNVSITEAFSVKAKVCIFFNKVIGGSLILLNPLAPNDIHIYMCVCVCVWAGIAQSV